MTKRVSETRTVLTQERLKELVHYNPETGVFTCLKKNNFRNVGDVIGTADNNGYLLYQIGGKSYKLHRLAFLYVTGNFPSNYIDHVNQRTNDNRWCNLREATASQNSCNRRQPKTSKSAIKGIVFIKGEFPQYRAHVRVGGKTVSKGLSLTGRLEDEVIQELVIWLKATREEAHKEFTKHD